MSKASEDSGLTFEDVMRAAGFEPNSEEYLLCLKFLCELRLKEIYKLQGRIEAKSRKKK